MLFVKDLYGSQRKHHQKKTTKDVKADHRIAQESRAPKIYKYEDVLGCIIAPDRFNFLLARKKEIMNQSVAI